VHPDTVSKWRNRLIKRRLDAVWWATLEETPNHATHWSPKQLADRSG
jgi:hypothetical protein